MVDPIRIFIVNDQLVYKTNLPDLIRTEPDFMVIGEADNVYYPHHLHSNLMPDLLIFNLTNAKVMAATMIVSINQLYPQLPVLIVSPEPNADELRALLAAGIVGYVLSNEGVVMLLHAIRTVVLGGTWFSSRIVAYISGWAQESSNPTHHLTPRESEVMILVAQGYTNTQIAHALGIAERTVRFHLEQIFTRWGVHNRMQAVMLAQQYGLLG